MNESVKEKRDLRAEELASDFSYDGYQVVRRELFAHQREAAAVIRKDSITFNTACIAGLEDAVYVQILVNPDNKRMVVRKCGENDKDALRWCIAKPDKRKSRKVTGKIFAAKLYDLMDWSTECRYKILGHKIEIAGEYIYIFDLTEHEIYMERKKVEKIEENANASEVPVSSDEKNTAEKISSRKPYYPENWRDSFGLPVDIHKNALEVDSVNGYTSFEL